MVFASKFLTMIIDTARHPLIAQITPGPKAPSRALLEGRAIDTCGFVSGDQSEFSIHTPINSITLPRLITDSPLTCPAGYTCTVDAAFFGCCGQLGCQSNWHACVPHDSPHCAGDNLSICSRIYTSVLIWLEIPLSYIQNTESNGQMLVVCVLTSS